MKNMGKEGYTTGDMSPVVEDYQRPMKVFSQEGFSKTTDYIERQNEFTGKEASKIKGQAYKGRYS